MDLACKDPNATAQRVIAEAWAEVQQRTLVGVAPRDVRLPSYSYDAATDRSTRANTLLRDITSLDGCTLPHAVRLTVEVARFHARRWATECDWYWTVFDPSGNWYGPFAPTAYNGVYCLSGRLDALERLLSAEQRDPEPFLTQLSDYARAINEFRERTVEQARRGMYMPRPQTAQALTLLERVQVRSANLAARLHTAPLASAAFVRDAKQRIRIVVTAFDRFCEALGPTYIGRTSDDVGMAQYTDGADIYAELIRHHTTLDRTPRELHAIGLERMASIHEHLRAEIREAGFTGTARAYYEEVNTHPAWCATTASDVTAVFRRYIDRIVPKLPAYFSVIPHAPYDVEPLSPALEDAMTFGYYRRPTADRPTGAYVFNARNLSRRGLLDLGPLTYHELMPGHHLHLAREFENVALHPLRAHASFTAFAEGWAEYAATLAGEMGMYATPEERFGRLVSDAFLTARLVLDTGLNALGWSLDRARRYLREQTMLSEGEIPSETLRYSCDIPGQALAYKSGELVLIALRERMRGALRERFDVRRFHDVVLDNGALPFHLVESAIDDAIASSVS